MADWSAFKPVARTPPLRQQQALQGMQAQDVTMAKGRADLAQAPVDKAIAETNLLKAQRELQNTPNAQKLTKEQSDSRAYYTAMKYGEDAYERAIAEKYDPNTAANIAAMAIESIIPGDVGIALSNKFRNPVSQRGRAGERTYTQGYQRAFSGAAVGEKRELPDIRAHLFPGAFSSKDPKNLSEMKAYRLAQMLTQREAGALPPERKFATAEDKLRANPGLRDQYDAKHGAGASDKVLGKRK
ncbi:hypothetical protein UFOVP1545_16 [uncultured Caudovirales phage]|uniref:Uncharacterized protein n=1 Tax=uncultured Caudovirales phage TaxID=2100421 RepID=A0A6J7XD14_9CAUD|nr:hypothetical protein UFOVP1545_16 [uncultured Caudovirales phage]